MRFVKTFLAPSFLRRAGTAGDRHPRKLESEMEPVLNSFTVATRMITALEYIRLFHSELWDATLLESVHEPRIFGFEKKSKTKATANQRSRKLIVLSCSNLKTVHI